MDPDDIVLLDDLRHSLAEGLVDPNVLFPELSVKFGIGGKVVEEWPECAVAESVVELVHCLAVDENGNCVVFRGGFGLQCLPEILLNIYSRPAEPDMTCSRYGFLGPLQVLCQT